jgi:hypothetical protein
VVEVFKVPFWMVVAGLSVAGGNLTQAQEFRVLAPHQHGPASLRHVREDGTADSTNWSGYAVTGANGSVTSVTGTWVVPVSTCGAKAAAAYASFWIGIDGWTSSTVEQIGTDSDCSSGKPSYYAWYEFYPQPSYLIPPLAINPGDLMSATVAYNTTTEQFTATITDETTQSAPFVTTFKSSTSHHKSVGAARSSAEWIAEAPSGGKILPLANFGTVLFGDDTGMSHAAACTVTIGGTTGTIGSFGESAWFATTMVTEKTDIPKAVPSALTKSGGGFSVTWENAGP